MKAKLHEVNANKKLTGRVPSVAEIQYMIGGAKELYAKVTYRAIDIYSKRPGRNTGRLSYV